MFNDKAQNDALIVEQVQKGNSQAYNLLVIKYQHKIRDVALKFTNNQADASDTTPVFVGVNGFHLSLKRNEPVLVPESVIRVLRDATTCRIETGADGRSRLSATRVPRFAFTVADRREDLTGA